MTTLAPIVALTAIWRDDVDKGSMRQPSPRPRIAGVAGGVGATVLARALDGLDRGVFTGRPVDVLVCRATGDSLRRAARAAAAGSPGTACWTWRTHSPQVAVASSQPSTAAGTSPVGLGHSARG